MNLFELFVKIGVDDQASGKLKDLGGKLGNGLKTAAKIGTAAVTAAAAGITALTTAAVNNYAEYEQLVGGVETLFKNASKKVQQYASEAYRTSGMSANDYMANATAFSASLINSLGGDTEKAAEYANRAMVSMSDNANKMGTSIESIVQTYQSLSRGNFAMLDNLKLGYGGTKAELERLIKDAASYTDIQKEMGVTVDASSMSFDNIVNAIAVVQGKLGVAGATAAEAGTTIEGSVNSMKAAWANLITGIADKNADLEGLVGDFVTTIVGDGTENNLGVLGNIMPAVKAAMKGAAKVIAKAAPIIAKELPSLMNEILPDLTDATAELIVALAENIPSIISALVEAAYKVVDAIGEAFAERIPALSFLFENLETVVVSLTAAFAAYKAAAAISGIIDALRKATEGQTLAQTLLNAVMNANPFVLIATVVAGLVTAIVTLWNTNDGFRDAVIGAWESIGDWFTNIGKNVVDGFKNGIKNAWKNLKDWFTGLFDDLIGVAKKILGIKSPSRVFKKIGAFTAEGFGEGFNKAFGDVEKDIESALDFNGTTFGVNAYGSYRGGGALSGIGGTSFGTVNINIEGYNAQDDDELAEMIAEKLQIMTERKGAVFA